MSMMEQDELDRRFCNILLDSLDETITSLLSGDVTDALYDHMQRVHSIRREEIPYRLETLTFTLGKVFGCSYRTIYRAFAKNFYAKLGLPFPDNSNYTLIQYVRTAKASLNAEQGESITHTLLSVMNL